MTTTQSPRAYPTPLEYFPDDGWDTSEIRHKGAVVALVPGVDDFPCLDQHGADGGAIQQEIDATGRKLVLSYNCHNAMVEALVAVWKFGSRSETDEGISVSYLVEEALKKAGYLERPAGNEEV